MMQPAHAGVEPIPTAAGAVIAAVHRAAAAKDYEGLRRHMVAEFNWSFGGDASAEQAIAEWKKQPDYMRQLARVTKLKCTYLKDRYVECPAGAGTNFRAGFKAVAGQWRMEYFVAGD